MSWLNTMFHIKKESRSPEWDQALTGRIKGIEDPEDLIFRRRPRWHGAIEYLLFILAAGLLWLALERGW